MTFREILNHLKQIELDNPKALDKPAKFLEPYDDPEYYTIGLAKTDNNGIEDTGEKIVPPNGYYFTV